MESFQFELCPELCPPSRDIAARTRSSEGWTYRPEIATELWPATRASVHASQPDSLHTAGKDAFVTIWVRDHLETWPVKDPHFKHWVGSLFYAKEGMVPMDRNIADALNVLQGRALYEGREKSVEVRIAGHQGELYVDLANDRWETIEITTSGWRVISDSPVRFRRTHGMLALPTAARGGNLSELRKFVNVGSDEQFLMMVGWLLASLRPNSPYPVLVLEGNQGSAKSTASKFLRSLVDPNTASVRSTPRSERDLIVAASDSWFKALEKYSEVPPWLPA